MKLLSDLLKNIRTIKLYAWEPALQEIIGRVRKLELDKLRNCSIAYCGGQMFFSYFANLVHFFEFTHARFGGRNYLFAVCRYYLLILHHGRWETLSAAECIFCFCLPICGFWRHQVYSVRRCWCPIGKYLPSLLGFDGLWASIIWLVSGAFVLETCT